MPSLARSLSLPAAMLVAVVVPSLPGGGCGGDSESPTGGGGAASSTGGSAAGGTDTTSNGGQGGTTDTSANGGSATGGSGGAGGQVETGGSGGTGGCGADCDTTCAIGGVRVDKGALDPSNACAACDPATSRSAYTSLDDGTACGAAELCSRGACISGCFIDGTVYPADTVNPVDACRSCAPATSTTDWSVRADGAACDVGKICQADVCTAGCFIAGSFHAPGDVDPTDACKVCDPATSTTDFSARASVPLLVGGVDVASQGWQVISQAPSTLTYAADYTRLATATNSGGRTSGQLLIALANAVDPAHAFRLQVEAYVESVNDHNQLDAAAAILVSFTGPAGDSAQRSEMIYLDNAKIGFADDAAASPPAAFSPIGAYHVYELGFDGAGKLTVSADGTPLLSRTGVTSNGTLAIGDQTNDPNVDGVMRVRAVNRMCN